jgi:hypothetical protein
MTSNQTRIELPVVTHWSNETQSYLYLAADAPEICGLASPPFKPGECYYEYNHNFLPDFNTYIADRYAETAITDENAREFITSASIDAGIPFDFLGPDAFTTKKSGIGRLLNQSNRVQILHAKVIDGSLATIILPPNWSYDAANSTYLIIFNDF